MANTTQLVGDIVTSRGKLGATNKNSVDEFHDSLSLEPVERKRRMDHQMSMARAANRRLKYEFKEKALAADHEFRLKKIEADRRLEELRLRLEFERLRASQVHPVLNTALPSAPTPRISPAFQSAPRTEPYQEFLKTPQYGLTHLLLLTLYLPPLPNRLIYISLTSCDAFSGYGLI